MWKIVVTALSWVIARLTLFFSGLAASLFTAFGIQYRLMMQGWIVKVFSAFFAIAIASIVLRLVAAMFCIFFLSPESIVNIILYVGGVSLEMGCSKLPEEVCQILAYAGINDFVNQTMNLFWRVGWFLYIIRGLKKLWVF